MSHPHNTEWLEAAHENFQSAVENGDIETAKAIIADTLEAGFDKEAQAMTDELREDKPSKFAEALILRSLKRMKTRFESQGLVPTLDLAIEELEAAINS